MLRLALWRSALGLVVRALGWAMLRGMIGRAFRHALTLPRLFRAGNVRWRMVWGVLRAVARRMLVYVLRPLLLPLVGFVVWVVFRVLVHAFHISSFLVMVGCLALSLGLVLALLFRGVLCPLHGRITMSGERDVRYLFPVGRWRVMAVAEGMAAVGAFQSEGHRSVSLSRDWC